MYIIGGGGGHRGLEPQYKAGADLEFLQGGGVLFIVHTQNHTHL